MRRIDRFGDYADSPDFAVVVITAVGVALVALVVFLSIERAQPDPTDTTIPTTVYTHPEEVTP